MSDRQPAPVPLCPSLSKRVVELPPAARSSWLKRAWWQRPLDGGVAASDQGCVEKRFLLRRGLGECATGQGESTERRRVALREHAAEK
eukprot:scaffold311771_cov41-Tisochrysis_lutea.AAC.2